MKRSAIRRKRELQNQQGNQQQQQQQTHHHNQNQNQNQDNFASAASSSAVTSSPPLHHAQQKHQQQQKASEPTLIQKLFTGTNITSPREFFEQHCDKKHLHLQRNSSNRPANFFSPQGGLSVPWSTKQMREVIRTREVYHKTDINIVRYDSGERRRIDFCEDYPLNNNNSSSSPPQQQRRVTLEEFEFAIKNGWSIRFLRPHEHVPELSRLIFQLEEELQCSCGMNSYWTPANSQGFAPHFDDVDVFLLQLEGAKHWRVYKNFDEADVLCRVSSEDFQQEQVKEFLIEDTVLRSGEMLYMPRALIHQGDTKEVNMKKWKKEQQQQQNQQQEQGEGEEETHSLHVTFSAFQMHTWADLIKETYAYRVEFAAANNIEFRHTLPLGWRTVMGSLTNPTMMGAHSLPLSAEEKRLRHELFARARKFFTEIQNALMTKDGILDKGADVIARSVLDRRQPPPVSSSVVSNSVSVAEGNNSTKISVTRDPTHIRLIFKNAVRFVMMTDEVRLYHCGGNSTICMAPHDDSRSGIFKAVWSKEDEGENDNEDENENDDEEQKEQDELNKAAAIAGLVRLDVDFGPALATIIAKSPSWVALKDLPALKFHHHSNSNNNNSNKVMDEFDNRDEDEEDDDDSTVSVEVSRQAVGALLATGCFEVKKKV